MAEATLAQKRARSRGPRADRQYHNARVTEWRRNNPDKSRRIIQRKRIKAVGIIGVQFPESLVCDLCGSGPSKKAFAMDHCHATKHFRGWLCQSCNLGLGQFKDSPALLRAAARYIENGGNADGHRT